MKTSRRTFLKTGFLMGLGPSLACAADKSKRSGRTVNETIIGLSRQAPLSMLFPGSTESDARRWQQNFRKKLAELLGAVRPPRQWSVQQQSVTRFADHTRYELLLRSPGVPSVPVYLLLPKGVSSGRPAPAVLCVHGHGKFGNDTVVGRTDLPGVAAEIAHANYDYGLQFVRRGYVVAAPCLIPFGRRIDRSKYGRSDPCAVTFVRMQAYGLLPIAANLRDLRWCLDLLQSRPEVQRDRLGCAGLSYGGRMTMLTAAMDRRIKVAAPSGAFNLLKERTTTLYDCGSQIIPGLLKYGDYSEIGSLIAPRPCVWEIGSRDSLIDPHWATVFRGRLEKIYTALGARKNLHFDTFTGGHRWNGTVAFPLFKKLLMT